MSMTLSRKSLSRASPNIAPIQGLPEPILAIAAVWWPDASSKSVRRTAVDQRPIPSLRLRRGPHQ